MSTIETLKSSSQTGEEIGSKKEGVKDNPFIAKEGDIMLTELNDKDRLMLQEKLKDLTKNSKSLRLNYQDKHKRLGEIETFKKDLWSLMEYLGNIYLILKSENIKNIDQSSLQVDKISNFDLELDFKKISDYTFSSTRSLLSLYSYCSNLYQKIALKEKEIKGPTQEKMAEEKEPELEEEMIY